MGSFLMQNPFVQIFVRSMILTVCLDYSVLVNVCELICSKCFVLLVVETWKHIQQLEGPTICRKRWSLYIWRPNWSEFWYKVRKHECKLLSKCSGNTLHAFQSKNAFYEIRFEWVSWWSIESYSKDYLRIENKGELHLIGVNSLHYDEKLVSCRYSRT